MTTLFISDLHLDASRAGVTKLFFEFLDTEARDAEALYILGDLFEAWVGDDDDDAHHRAVIARLQGLSASTPVYVMHGNRDFLLGERFARETHATLLDDEVVVDLYGTPSLLLHGDTLCTDDAEYQAFRRTARDPAWQREMLAKPLEERRAIAHGARERSRIENSMKPDNIMDVNPEAVADAFRRHGVSHMIHGHTHRPAVHELEVDGRHCERIVLGDWYDQGSVLRVSPDGYDLETI